jgi:protein-tyrosine phosphatase
MFENRKPGLEAAFSNFRDAASHLPDIPTLGLGAEHHFDDVVWALFLEGQAVPYPGGHGALIEFPERAFPMGVEHRFFELMVKGIRPVIAHPERYLPLFKKTDPIDPLLEVGALPLLDVMSLAGRYGRHPQRAAERMVKEGVYYAACTDAHRLSDLPLVEEAIERLRRLVGEDEAEELLADHPRAILEGRVVS